MSLSAKITKGGLQLALGTVGQQLLQFIRSAAIARLLPTEQFGIALTFVTVLAALEAFTELGLELFIIRAKNVEDETLQQTAHTFSIIRGITSSIIMFLLAYPIAAIFDVPQAAWAYRWLALAPLARTLLHLDYLRFQRYYRYWPSTVITFLSVLIGTSVSIAGAYLLKDSIAIVVGTIAQVVALVIGSHLVAERKYALAYVKEHAAAIYKFGTPMLFNASVLFAQYQGDRVTIASLLGVRELVTYGTVAILTSAVAALVMRVTGALYLPLLAEHSPNTDAYKERYSACGVVASFAATMATIPFAFIGVELTHLAFGAKSDPTALLVILLACQGGLKIVRMWTQQAFIATAQLLALVLSNLASASGLVLAFFAVKAGFGMEGVAFSVVLSEILAAAVSILAIRKYPGLASISVKYFGLTILAYIPLLVYAWLNFDLPANTEKLILMFAYMIVASGILLIVSPSFKTAARTAISKLRKAA